MVIDIGTRIVGHHHNEPCFNCYAYWSPCENCEAYGNSGNMECTWETFRDGSGQSFHHLETYEDYLDYNNEIEAAETLIQFSQGYYREDSDVTDAAETLVRLSQGYYSDVDEDAEDAEDAEILVRLSQGYYSDVDEDAEDAETLVRLSQGYSTDDVEDVEPLVQLSV
jgi:hypothetical protein